MSSAGRACFLSVCLASGAWAQAQAPASANPATPESVRAAMQDSLRAQRDSVQAQMQSVGSHPLPKGDPAPFSSAPMPILRNWQPCDPIPQGTIDPAIRSAAAQHGISSNLLRSVVATESGFVPCAVSDKGALGLMQLMPETAVSMGVINPFDPTQNLEGGVRYLQQLLIRYGGDVRLALGAYNAGPALVDKYGDIPPIPETQNYVMKIMKELGASATASPAGVPAQPAAASAAPPSPVKMTPAK